MSSYILHEIAKTISLPVVLSEDDCEIRYTPDNLIEGKQFFYLKLSASELFIGYRDLIHDFSRHAISVPVSLSITMFDSTTIFEEYASDPLSWHAYQQLCFRDIEYAVIILTRHSATEQIFIGYLKSLLVKLQKWYVDAKKNCSRLCMLDEAFRIIERTTLERGYSKNAYDTMLRTLAAATILEG